MLTMPNSCLSDEASVSSETKALDYSGALSPLVAPVSPLRHQQPSQTQAKKKRNQPGNPGPDAEVVALSPKSLMATNRFVCEVCNKGFQRDQNLQLHRRGHNLPWKLRQRSSREVVKRRVYVCPVATCVHHQPSRALGDLTGIKKHYSRKHGEKKWKCDKCSKRYAVHSDWKAHVKTCGTREYRCDCGTLFSRKDSFITHRAFCDALAQESARLMAAAAIANTTSTSMTPHQPPLPPPPPLYLPFSSIPTTNPNPDADPNAGPSLFQMRSPDQLFSLVQQRHAQAEVNATSSSPNLSATALLQKATAMGVMPITHADGYDASCMRFEVSDMHAWQGGNRPTRDFLGVVDDANAGAEGQLLPLADVVSRGDPTRPITAFQFPTATDRWGNHC